jgi:protein TIF31
MLAKPEEVASVHEQLENESPAVAETTDNAAESEQVEQPAQGEDCLPTAQNTSDPVVHSVVVHLPSPSHSRTLPKKSSPDEVFHTITLLPQSHETVQELKLAINEWIGGYWLGPYSLRIPAAKPAGNGHAEGAKSEADAQLGKAREGVDVRAGAKLSEWLEVGELFSHVQEGEERVLEVVRGE